ncbi:MAG: peptidyl-prolyl cis-trans isomerase [Acidobacteriota bacterium]
MKFIIGSLLFLSLFMLPTRVSAQEPELVTEIVARVNNDIITRADYLAAVEEFRIQLTKELRDRGKSDAEIEAEFQKLKPTILDILIDDILVEQKAKELGANVENELNQQWTEIAKNNKFPSVLDFENALKQQGNDPEAIRASLRKRLLQQFVMNQEIFGQIYRDLTEKQKREYYDKHKEEFTTPIEVTISEIFLPLENQTASEVEQRARRIVAELRAGKNFVEAVQAYSGATRPTRALNGKLGTFKLTKDSGLRPDLEAAIKDLKTGEITEPLRQQDGFQIIRVDERKEATTIPYSDPQVQRYVAQAATMERADDARKKYLKKLRDEAFIEINKSYVVAVEKKATN